MRERKEDLRCCDEGDDREKSREGKGGEERRLSGWKDNEYPLTLYHISYLLQSHSLMHNQSNTFIMF